jgi:hypothetical protein
MSRRILTFQPLVYTSRDERFRVTNLGAIVSALNQLGHNAQQVAYWPTEEQSAHEIDGILLCSPEQATNPKWWKMQKPWAVITNTWGAPRFDAIRRAILQATPRLLDRLDTDGARSPHICWASYLYRDWSSHHDSLKLILRNFAIWQSLAQGIAMRVWPGLLDTRMSASLAEIPVVTAESPIAVERMRRYQRKFGYSGTNIHLSPFPVSIAAPEQLVLKHKKNRVISVGRWEAHQKNFTLLLHVLHEFLTFHPDWDAVLLGCRHPQTQQLLSKYCTTTQQRIQVPGSLPNTDIQQRMAQSKVFLMASRHESFGIAAAEALCLGCSVVGPAHIPSIPWFCGSNSGTSATLYTCNGLLDALSAEANAWKNGKRNMETIADVWRSRVGAKKVSAELLAWLEKIDV